MVATDDGTRHVHVCGTHWNYAKRHGLHYALDQWARDKRYAQRRAARWIWNQPPQGGAA